MSAPSYETAKVLAQKLASFAGQDPDAALQGHQMRAEVLMRLRDGIRARGATQASLNVPRVWMNYLPAAERMLERDPVILDRIAAGYVPPLRRTL